MGGVGGGGQGLGFGDLLMRSASSSYGGKLYLPDDVTRLHTSLPTACCYPYP